MRKQLRRRGNDAPDSPAALARLQEVAREQTERFGPYADQARVNAEQRLRQARCWTAPRLEVAAHRVEDTVAPRVADLLSLAAHRVEPNRARRGLIAARRNGRRVPRFVVFAGVAGAGALAVYGALKLRKAAQDAEWQENLDQAREQVRETREQLTTKAKEARDKVSRTAEEQASTDAPAEEESPRDFNGRVKR
ncbi:cysteine sulfinate desulfinase/cysteine desulfurase-like protein [Lipingzhangella halophila]|uniref:Cysteine sulfinate desulfinase/cysteine desulfurase-like protein n=1 Tax=Lipingzhangella halophila TaxID=1783352 RepID=A0A7W7W753_9ACTN|nr:hypothetical protein [Lipingzhangella halophila]MBB4935550.1 cysteine sulfinate desulfinase/cysteine desulfurase-like protein [Lipingzhangella halophila]